MDGTKLISPSGARRVATRRRCRITQGARGPPARGTGLRAHGTGLRAHGSGHGARGTGHGAPARGAHSMTCASDERLSGCRSVSAAAVSLGWQRVAFAVALPLRSLPVAISVTLDERRLIYVARGRARKFAARARAGWRASQRCLTGMYADGSDGQLSSTQIASGALKFRSPTATSESCLFRGALPSDRQCVPGIDTLSC